MKKILFALFMLTANIAYCQQNVYELLGDTVFHKKIVYSPQEVSEKEILLECMTRAGMTQDTKSDYDLYFKTIFHDKALYPYDEYDVIVIELWIIRFNYKNIIKQN